MIKLAISIFIAALTLFLIAEAVFLLPASDLKKVFYQVGALALLASFSILFTHLILLTGILTIRRICHYFSGTERQQRRQWFTLGKLEQEHHLFSQRTLKIRYFLNLKIKRLESANDRKHSRSLAKAIEQDLAMIKSHVPPDQFKAWQQQNTQYRRQANVEGLIALQQTIITHS